MAAFVLGSGSARQVPAQTAAIKPSAIWRVFMTFPFWN
jgi:hypothetical protein